MSDQDWADRIAELLHDKSDQWLETWVDGGDGNEYVGLEIDKSAIAALIRSTVTAPRELVEALRKVASAKDNEATAYPVWYIVDPRQMMSRDVGRLVSMITGPFFSRESATETMKALRHRYKNPSVYCDSGYDSPDWVELYEASRSALTAHEPKVCEWGFRKFNSTLDPNIYINCKNEPIVAMYYDLSAKPYCPYCGGVIKVKE